MLKIIWLPLAENQRAEQLEYIARDNPRAAADQDERVGQRLRALKAHPRVGRPGRVPDTRELVISGTPFIVVYRLRAERIEVIRFLHGAQQWPQESP